MLCFALRDFFRLFAQRRNPALCLTLVLLLTQYSVAQSGMASLSGTITDQSGALLPGVRVTITNEGTGISIEKQTNGAGVYNTQGLNPGRYRVFVTKEGFMQVDVRDMTLDVQDSVSRNFTLRIGGTSETVQVDGNRKTTIVIARSSRICLRTNLTSFRRLRGGNSLASESLRRLPTPISASGRM